MLTITSSVGRSGANLKADAKIVQLLINKNIELLKPLPKLNVDGMVGRGTVEAIEAFQKKVLKSGKPDGRVDPGAKTFKALALPYRNFSISGATIHPSAKQILVEILLDAGLTKAIVTSGVRTPADQARIMYDNIKLQGLKDSYGLYSAFGDKVVKVFEENMSKERAEVISLMKAKIEEIGPANVTKHCSATHYVFDVAPSSIANHIRFIASTEKHKAVSKLLKPPLDRAFHIEIPKDSPSL